MSLEVRFWQAGLHAKFRTVKSEMVGTEAASAEIETWFSRDAEFVKCPRSPITGMERMALQDGSEV
jgi:hypothetical protein